MGSYTEGMLSYWRLAILATFVFVLAAVVTLNNNCP